jgi:hypothetical protein
VKETGGAVKKIKQAHYFSLVSQAAEICTHSAKLRIKGHKSKPFGRNNEIKETQLQNTRARAALRERIQK